MEASDVFEPHVLGAADRIAGIAERHEPACAAEFHAAADRIRAELIAHSWKAGKKSFVGHYGGEDLDASLLQMARLRFLPPGETRLGSMIDITIWRAAVGCSAIG